jgi:hypothetical protein
LSFSETQPGKFKESVAQHACAAAAQKFSTGRTKKEIVTGFRKLLYLPEVNHHLKNIQ